MVIKLETERLLLRKPRRTDYKDIYEGVKDKEISKYLGTVPYPYKEKDAKDFIELCLKKWAKKKKTAMPFFIEFKPEKKIIGVLDLIKIDKFQGTAEIGFWLNQNYHRLGIMTEAKIVLHNFAFNNLTLRKLHTRVYADNTASIRIHLKTGYTKEGMRKQQSRDMATGKVHDEILFGLLKSEWKKNLPILKKEIKEKAKKSK